MTDGSVVVRSTRSHLKLFPERVGLSILPRHAFPSIIRERTYHSPTRLLPRQRTLFHIFRNSLLTSASLRNRMRRFRPQPAVSGIHRKYSVASANPQAIGLFRAVGCSRYAWSNVDGMLTLRPALPRTQVCYIGTGLRARCQQ